MAAEKTPGDHMALCLGSGGGGPNRAVSEDTGNEDTAAAEERRQVARYKQTLWEFKLSAIVIVLVLAFWVALLLVGTLDHHMSESWRQTYVSSGMVASGPWLFMVICHLRDYGLSVPKMSDFSNQEHQLPPRGPRPLLTDGYRSIIPHKRGSLQNPDRSILLYM
ncbi:Os04g0664000 [Oryza sativa Japonica Group]|uniref:Os04g0664000 protein n=2 Tax=Oryza sativa subsp. japonica TaxID=39947 RepID=Q7XM11_ORYSJ|nr:Os04g0664000 [Oryza sativa Japonica Group]CAE04848.2 OSJNBa0084K01.20 [Oryza sativa Japonica Group]